MNHYGSQTTVTPERSRAEIERVLSRAGATAFCYGWTSDGGSIAFELRGRRMRFNLPPLSSEAGTTTPAGRRRHNAANRARAREQEIRQRWRALYLVIRAKLEAVAAGIVTLEEEFLAQTLLPDGRTVGAVAMAQLGPARATVQGSVPARLLLVP